MREFMSFMRNNNMLVNDIAILNISFIWLFRLPSLQLSCKNSSYLAADMCKYIGYIVFNKFELCLSEQTLQYINMCQENMKNQ